MVTGVIRTLLLIATFSVAAHAQGVPTVEDAKRAIDHRLQKIWKDLGRKGTRTVVFQNVLAGRNAQFRATLTVHDYTTGYPPNRFYGTTCVSRLDEEVYTVSQDNFGGWDAQGRMTPDLSTQTCKNNPSEGVPAIPVSSLQGSRAGSGGGGDGFAQQQQPQQQQAAGGSGVAPGAYQCWANGQARLLLNFTALAGGQYRDNQGAVGSMTVGAGGRVTFRGGLLDGFMPAGFYAVYYSPGGRPTVSFRNSGGGEVQFCQHQ